MHLGFLFPTHKPMRSGFCSTTQLKLFPVVNVNSLIGKTNNLFLHFVPLDILATQDTLVTAGPLKFHLLAAWLYHPGSSDHIELISCWLPSLRLSVPTCGLNSHSLWTYSVLCSLRFQPVWHMTLLALGTSIWIVIFPPRHSASLELQFAAQFFQGGHSLFLVLGIHLYL